MFFSERILSIKPTDKVLEIGPGATPFGRSDVFLEKKFDTDQEYIAQSGHVGRLKTDKEIVYYNGNTFPFKDKEFDYVICSHVLEHVENPDQFIQEIQRVGKKGYLEFPSIYYEYLYDLPEHLNVLFYTDNEIRWLTKKEAGMETFKSIQKFFYRSLEQEYYSLVNDLKNYMILGFEWENKINIKKANSIEDLCYDISKLEIPAYKKESKNFVKPKDDMILKIKKKIKSIF